MNKYKNDKNINIERENIEVDVEKLQIFGPRSKTRHLVHWPLTVVLSKLSELQGESVYIKSHVWPYSMHAP